MAAFFEGIGTVLLIPLIRGLIEMNYAFLREIPVFEWMIVSLNQLGLLRNAYLFGALIGITVGALVLKNIFSYFSQMATCRIVFNYESNLRKAIFSRYLHFGKFFFDQTNIGHLQYILLGHTNHIRRNLQKLEDIFLSTCTLAIYFILMVWISWPLTLLLMVTFPVLYFSLQWIMTKIKEASRSHAESIQILSSKVSNALSCIPLVKAYAYETAELGWFKSASDRLSNQSFNIEKKSKLVRPVQEVLTLFMLMFIVIITAYLFVRQGMGEPLWIPKHKKY